MHKSARSFAKIGCFCALFCLYAGVRYVPLPEQLRFVYGVDCGLPMPQETSVVAFEEALVLFSASFVVWSILRRQYILPAFAILFFANENACDKHRT
jgi:hypothetical protein